MPPDLTLAALNAVLPLAETCAAVHPGADPWARKAKAAIALAHAALAADRAAAEQRLRDYQAALRATTELLRAARTRRAA